MTQPDRNRGFVTKREQYAQALAIMRSIQAAMNRPERYDRYVLGPHPKTLTMEDLPSLQSSSKLFARKFDAEMDGAILDELDRRVHAQEQGPLPAALYAGSRGSFGARPR